MSEPSPDPRGVPRFRRPAPLLFEPAEAAEGEGQFFGLESIADPRELLGRSTELALAFRSASDRAMEFQAIAAAQLADPKRFDRLSDAAIADRGGWTESYARKMIEFGRKLIADRRTD
ncbi:hypothetical protein [Streptomyces sp. ODS28]|uniref:hypothetical protein n=1 Tax=Streptomyces sp. ODS28 TaxID=3136688 RepID=UPI0031E50567